MKIVSLTLQTAILEELNNFYTQVLGLDLIEEHASAFTIKVGSSYLTFEGVTNDTESPFYHFAFDIPTNKIEEAVEWLTSKNIKLNLLPDHKYQTYSQSWNSTSIYFYDPAGNILECIARHSLNYFSNDSFSSRSLLNISEIGLVFDHALLVKPILEKHFSLTVYKNYNEAFIPVGDEQGLFILCAKNRTWLGSNKQAQIYKTEVVIEGDQYNNGELTFDDYPYIIKGVYVQ